MVYKLCAYCGNYFEGSFDGSYSCPDCSHNESSNSRALIGGDQALVVCDAPLAPLFAGSQSAA